MLNQLQKTGSKKLEGENSIKFHDSYTLIIHGGEGKMGGGGHSNDHSEVSDF